MYLARTLAELNACRLHGNACRTPWGYDEAHTDSSRPYTVDELAEREGAPHRYAYPTLKAYEEGFALWRSLRRDAEPTYTERLTATAVKLAPIMGGRVRHAHSMPGCPVGFALRDLTGVPDGFHSAAALLCGCEPLRLPVVPYAGHRVTAESDRVHGDGPSPAGPEGVRPGTNRTGAHRTGTSRTTHTPAPGRP